MRRPSSFYQTIPGAIALAIMLGALTATASANHDYNILEARADAMYHTMLDMDRTFVRSYVRSRVFGEIMATSGQIKGKAIHLRVMAKHGTPCDWSREIRQLDRLVCKLPALVEEARFRAAKGIDPPIGDCNLDSQLIVLSELMQCMKDALYLEPVIEQPVIEPVVRPAVYAPVTRPRPPRRNYGHRGGRDYRDADYYRAPRKRYDRYSDFACRVRGPYGNGLAISHRGLTLNGKNGFGLHLDF